MIFTKDPRQQVLFDEYAEVVGPRTLASFAGDWPGLIRDSLLHLMPVREVSESFSADAGCPTKELYAVCGLFLLQDFFGWTVAESVSRFNADMRVRYALNIGGCHEISERSFYRYQRIIREKELGLEIMDGITAELVKLAGIRVDEQRLDSTHVFCNMAVLSRNKLMFTVTERFLVQVKRHLPAGYAALPEPLRARYERGNGWIFAANSPMKTLNYGDNPGSTTAEQLGFDMRELVERFSGTDTATAMTSYKNLLRVFNEQIETDDAGRPRLKAHPGGCVMVNPSDPEAGIGHKGAGYQAQVLETCHPDNPVQLVTAVVPQTAAASDMNSCLDAISAAADAGHKPDSVLADAGYGSNDNVNAAAEAGVELVAPSLGKKAGTIGLEECTLDDHDRVIACPCGHRPIQSRFTDGKGRAVFRGSTCAACPERGRCSARKDGKNRSMKYDSDRLMLRRRRLIEATPEFRERYRKRPGIEALFGRLKQFSRLRRLRCRGKKASFTSICLIFAMHNVIQAARALAEMAKTVRNGLSSPVFMPLGPLFSFPRGQTAFFQAA